ncbi:MAG: peptidase M16 [Gammaproteobacteria bacterium RIFCSPLOWO2_02_FULL_57_10]|nr:MAG: peptidase M16 [Gammaproteobacteria bacterium RIFCSPLOWO2_02_FULL_57_10]
MVGCADDSSVNSTTATTEEAAAAPAGYELVETVTSNDADIVIPYKKYVYANGLTVLLHEDDSDPLVHVNITYHVGSAREEPQRSGFAHFFEHMMFQGSAHVGDDEHFQIVTEAGGTLNGSTSTDRTNYFQTVPSNQLETILWLEADRMGFLLEAVTQEKFEIQRSTVKNERGQNVENRPYGRVYEEIIAALYPSGHPYSWPVIGYPEDLDAATLDDLRHFFLRWYGPNNATLIVAGNLEEESTLALIDKYFGSIPAGPAVDRAVPQSIALDQDRYVSYVDQNIRFPLLVMAYPSVPYSHPDRVPLAALASILGEGKNSLLYQEFVVSNRTIDASASNSAQELSGMFSLEAQTFPGANLAEFETDMRRLLSEFGPNSFTDEDLETFKGRTEASLINGLEGVQGKASRLALYDYLIDNPNYLPQELEALRSLTREDVLRVFNQYVANKPAVMLSVLTQDAPDAQSQPDNFSPTPALRVTDSSLDDLEPRPVTDTFDRAVRPGAGQTPLVEVPPFWREQLANGAEIIGTVSNEIPTVALRLTFMGGHLLNGSENYGLARLTAAMLNEGTEQLSAEQFEMELQKLGSRINVSAGRDNMTVTVGALSRNLDATLSLLEQRLLQPSFTQENLDRLRRQQIETLQASREQPNSIAEEVYSKLIYGEDHSFAVPVNGRIEALEAVTLDDIEAFARESLATAALQIVAVGDAEQSQIVSGLAFLDNLQREPAPEREQPALPQIEGNTLYLVDKPGAAQSEIRIGYVTDMPWDATGEYFKTSLMNYVLGGAFSSRINLNLREDKGYTYGARSFFSGTTRPGDFTASASVRMDSSADSVRQFVNEITSYRDAGITAEELAFTRSAVGQRDALNYETPAQKAGFLGRIVEYELSADYVREQAEIIDTITQEEINALAREKLPFERMVILVVGDKAVIGESIAELGYPIVELDTTGAAVE